MHIKSAVSSTEHNSNDKYSNNNIYSNNNNNYNNTKIHKACMSVNITISEVMRILQ